MNIKENLLTEFLLGLPVDHRKFILLHDTALSVINIWLPDEERDRRRLQVHMPGDEVDPENDALQAAITTETIRDIEDDRKRSHIPCILPEYKEAVKRREEALALGMVIAKHDLQCFHCGFATNDDVLSEYDIKAKEFLEVLNDEDQRVLIEQVDSVIASVFSGPKSFSEIPVPKDIGEEMKHWFDAAHFRNKCHFGEVLNRKALLVVLKCPYLFWDILGHAENCERFRNKIGKIERELVTALSPLDMEFYQYCARVLTRSSPYLFS